MSALFSPITLRGLTLPNRIVVSPMCQYSSDDGAANDWHLIHLGGLALSGAGMLCIEATAVEPEGRITPSDLGLYDDRTEAALRSVLAAVRKYSRIPVAMQLAHAGRKASSHVPWQGGQLIAQAEGGWLPVAPSAVPQREHEPPPAELDAAGLARIREAFVATAKRAVGLGIDALEIHNAHGYISHNIPDNAMRAAMLWAWKHGLSQHWPGGAGGAAPAGARADRAAGVEPGRGGAGGRGAAADREHLAAALPRAGR